MDYYQWWYSPFLFCFEHPRPVPLVLYASLRYNPAQGERSESN
jgi:hypothetical protein